MRPRSLVTLALIAAAAGCSTDIVTPGSLARPTDLSYQLLPSGDPNAPSGVVLRWTEPSDSRVANYVVYSRAYGGGWSRRAETTSNTFHDAGIPHDQYATLTCDQKQGAWGEHGVHYFATGDTDNAIFDADAPLTEIDAQQWQFAVPTSSPHAIGEPYAEDVRAPLIVTGTPG